MAVALLTARGIPYSSRTLFPGLRLLTERAQATWSGGDVQVAMTPPPRSASMSPRSALAIASRIALSEIRSLRGDPGCRVRLP